MSSKPKLHPLVDALQLTCPHCGQGFATPLDGGEGRSEFVVDCEICCRPMEVSVEIRDGAVSAVNVTES